MWAHPGFDPAHGLVAIRQAELLAEAAEDRRAREARSAPPALVPAGVLLIVCGHALIRAGERLAGPRTDPSPGRNVDAAVSGPRQ